MIWRRRRTSIEDSPGVVGAAYAVTLTLKQFGDVVVVQASAVPEDPPWWQWFLHDQPAGLTRSSEFAVTLGEDDAAEIRVIALETPDIEAWDYVLPATDGRITLEWGDDATDDTISVFRIDEAYSAPSNWSQVGYVVRDGKWRYKWVSPRYGTGFELYLRVVPVTAEGDEDAVLEIGPITTARRPDAPAVAASFDSGTQQITISDPG